MDRPSVNCSLCNIVLARGAEPSHDKEAVIIIRMWDKEMRALCGACLDNVVMAAVQETIFQN